ncbi:MAG: response regulator transcription factor [Chloroflexi bacterium]|jgi:two-component system response regulator MprA|nr:response regulator transcription factor [Chloroflexota bacterium]OJW04298.1 MAG: DNA-binding response regulator [Chloroflexi bacterium 54-19]
MPKILVVDDEPQINDFLRRGLTYKGFDVAAVSNGEDALNSARDYPPDLVVLDIMLPDMTGYEVCRRLRASGDRNLPILMLTARDALTDKISGLDCGADDYITKPFAFEELLARIRANLRRVEHQNRPNRKLEVGDLVIDPAIREVRRGDRLVELTSREFDLLELLTRHQGQVLTKEIIFERIWGYDNESGIEVIKVYINYLRSKLNAGGKPDMIHSVRGIGYILKP